MVRKHLKKFIFYPFMVKVLEGSDIQTPYKNIIKVIYSKPISNSKLTEEKLEAIPIKSDRQTVDSLPTYSI